jgi:hypothetical protein
MHRRRFLGLSALAAGGVSAMNIKEFIQQTRDQGPGPRMPSIFIGHGSPMNALADNAFTHHLADLGRKLDRPKAVLVISAHWLTPGRRPYTTSEDSRKRFSTCSILRPEPPMRPTEQPPQ